MSAHGALTPGDFPNRGPAILAVVTATFVIATVFFLARVVSRVCIVRKVDWDDWIMMLAWLIAFGLSFSVDYGTAKGLGRKDVNIKDEWKPALRRSEYAFTILYNPALMATKTSMLIFYLRLSRNTVQLLRIASFVTLGVAITAGIVLTSLNIFQCRPVSAAYHVNQDGAQCIGIVTLYLASAPVNIITDLAILILPIPVLTSMTLPTKQKTILIFTFSLGVFIIAVDVIRIYYLQKAALDQVTGVLDGSSDVRTRINYTYNSSLSFMWSCVEVNTGIICACIPTLKPLVSRILPRLIDHLPGSNNKVPQVRNENLARTTSLPVQRTYSGRQAPLPYHEEHGNPEAELEMMDFLTTSDTRRNAVVDLTASTMYGNANGSRLEPTRTETTINSVYFGFVSMKRPKSMMKTKDIESFKYCVMVTILFFLWGFSYGFLNTLNDEIGKIYHDSNSQTLALQTAYFGAYGVGPLVIGQWVLRNGGFKATFITGLCVYGIGTLAFWPSAVLTSFAGFMVSNFITGLGLSILETAANPFIALCGPMKHSEFRLLIVQGVQAIGSVFSPLIAQRGLFRKVQTDANLIDVQWTYLGIAFFSVVLAIFFYYMPLPEALDEELQEQSDKRMMNEFSENFTKPRKHFGVFPIVYTTIVLGVAAQWFYVAAQESISVWFNALLGYFIISQTAQTPALSTENYLLLGHATFAVSRFIFAILCLYIRPRILLLISMLGALLFTVLTFAISQNNTNPIAGAILCLFFFEGPGWPLIYAISLRNLGRHTKLGAAFLTFGASGGSGFPFIMYAVQNGNADRIQYSFCVIIALFCAAVIFPIYLNAFSTNRALYDPETDGSRGSFGSCMSINLGIHPSRARTPSDTPPGSASSSTIQKLSHSFLVLFERIKDSASRRSSCEDPLEAGVEHRERRKSSVNT